MAVLTTVELMVRVIGTQTAWPRCYGLTVGDLDDALRRLDAAAEASYNSHAAAATALGQHTENWQRLVSDFVARARAMGLAPDTTLDEVFFIQRQKWVRTDRNAPFWDAPHAVWLDSEEVGRRPFIEVYDTGEIKLDVDGGWFQVGQANLIEQPVRGGLFGSHELKERRYTLRPVRVDGPPRDRIALTRVNGDGDAERLAEIAGDFARYLRDRMR